jgi:hypothetical protein
MKCKDCPKFEFSLRRAAIAGEGYMRLNNGYCRLKDEHVNGKRLTSCMDHPEAESKSEEELRKLRHAETCLRYRHAKVESIKLTTQGLRYRQTRARSGKGGYSQLQSEKLKNSLLTAEDKK